MRRWIVVKQLLSDRAVWLTPASMTPYLGYAFEGDKLVVDVGWSDHHLSDAIMFEDVADACAAAIRYGGTVEEIHVSPDNRRKRVHGAR